jgi:hypothetical protein
MTEDELKRKLEDSFRCGIGYCTSVGACASRAIKVFRAAGWSPPIPSNLRVVEKCNGVNHKMGMNPYDKDCLLCDNKGTIKRDLKPEELVEGYEKAVQALETMMDMSKSLYGPMHFQMEMDAALTLASRAKVVLVEGNDDKE